MKVDQLKLLMARRIAGYSRRRLALELGWKPQKICQMETGNRACRISEIQRVAEVLGVNWKKLLHG